MSVSVGMSSPLNLPAYNSAGMPALLTLTWWALQLLSRPLSSSLKQFGVWFCSVGFFLNFFIFLFEGKMIFVTFACTASVFYSWNDLFQCPNAFSLTILFPNISLIKNNPASPPMWLSTYFFSCLCLPLLCQSVTNSSIVRTQAIPHPSPPPSNSSARRITSVSSQISLGFIWLSNGFKALVS